MKIPALDPSIQQFLDGINQISDRLNRAQREVSTGLRVQQVSDDPDQVSTILQARANLDAAQQIQVNLRRVKAEVDTAEQSLQSAVQLFDRVQTLGAEGATGTQTASSRADLAQELGSILDQMVGLSGTSVAGRYIFSGDSDQQAPYTVDLSQPSPVSAYLGSPSTRLVQHPNGSAFPVARTAQEIFDAADPAQNAFRAINTLRTALIASDQTAIETAVDGLPKVASYLNSQLAFYGMTQNKVGAATDFGQNLQLQLQGQISNLQDADLTSAILEMQQAQTQQQAALTSRAQMPRATLFDFLA